MKLPIVPLSQKDPAWGYKRLGTGQEQIRSSGCALVSVCMWLNHTGYKVTPLELNENLINNNGFSNGNLMNWNAIPALYPKMKWEGRTDYQDGIGANLSIIDSYLAKNMPVIACLDYDPDPDFDQHFVLFVGKEGGDYLINDPMSTPPGETYWFSAKYGDITKNLYGFRLYSAQLDTTFHLFQGGVEVKTYDKNPEDTISDLEAKLKGANEALSAKVLEADTYRNELAAADQDNKDLADQLNSARQERDEAIRESRIFADQIAQLQGGLDSRDEEISKLTEALGASQTLLWKDVKTSELVKELLNRILRRR